ncbi:hypothetical protein Q7P35_007393 [Cladosporium inversicolor]
MSSYIPPAGTYQPEQPSTLRPGTNRSRANSATAEKYRPRTYSNPPPNQPDPSLLGPHQHPYAPPDPSFYPQRQPPHQPPYPQDTISQPQTPIPMPMPMLQQVLAPTYPNPPISAPGPSSRHSSYTHPRPPLAHDEDNEGEDRRRHSYSSQVSRHSHDSRHSRDSKRSRHSRNSVDVRYEDKAQDHHKSKHGQKQHPNRTNERPTMGDSLVSMFGLIKSALGPRDK